MFDKHKIDERMNRLYSGSFFVAVCMAFVSCLAFQCSTIQKTSIHPVQLENRINPNEASAASLMRLPGIGISKANAVIEYRNKFQQNNPCVLAFKNCDDLDKIKGIGPVTLNNLCPFLKFE